MTEPSNDLAVYLEQTAAIIGLPIPSEYQEGVVQNFERISAIAQLVMDFPISEDLEIAPVFDPEG